MTVFDRAGIQIDKEKGHQNESLLIILPNSQSITCAIDMC